MNWIEIRQENFDFFLRYQIPRERLVAPLKAAYNTINQIILNYPPPYTLMLSGGVDSQAMLYAWHTSGIPYKTFSAIYNDGLNENDLCTLVKFSEKHCIPISFIDFDLLKFLETEHINYVHKFRCGSPHMTTFMKLSELVTDGTVIMSGNFMLEENRLPISKNNFGLYTFGKIMKKSIVPFFFCETQELAFSFKLKTKLDKSQFKTVGPSQSIPNYLGYADKVQRYLDNEFPVIPQEYKITGFELVKDYYDKHFTHLLTPKDRLAVSQTQKSRRTFDLMLRNKFEMLYAKDKFIVLPYYE